MDFGIWKRQFNARLGQMPMQEKGTLRWLLGPELPVSQPEGMRPCILCHGTTGYLFVGAKADVEQAYSRMLGNDSDVHTCANGRKVWRFAYMLDAKRRFYKMVAWALGERATFAAHLRAVAEETKRAEAKRILSHAAALAAQGRQRAAIQILSA